MTHIHRLIPMLSAVVVAFRPVYASAGTGQPDTLDPYLRMIWGLLVVLGIILLLYGLLKKRFSLLAQSPQQQIRIVEMKPLMGRKALCLVEVRGEEFLLGICGDRIEPIACLGKKASFAETLKRTGVDGQS